MTPRDEALQLLRAHLQAAAALADALVAPPPEPDDDSPEGEPGPACPSCGEKEKLEDTSTDGPRVTCLACGTSFAPPEVKRG